MPAPAALPTPELFPPTLLTDVLAVSLTAINLLRPLYDAGDDLKDFAVEYLNPAAQRMTGLAERPGGTMRERFPTTFDNGVFELYKRVFERGEAGRHDFYYQADGFNNYFQVAARRSGELLVVSFTDTADHGRTAAVEALRESQAREALARSAAETALRQAHEQGELLARTLGQVPASVATLSGPAHCFAYLNDQYLALTAGRAAVGRTVAEALPEVVGQGFIALLDEVYATGRPYLGAETPIWLHEAATGQPVQRYLNFTYQPLPDAQGQVVGILVFAVDVTAQVLARRQVQDVNQELAALNEELRATNEEYLLANTALADSQYQQLVLNQELDAFNQDLEARVAVRTREAHQQRARLERLVMTAPLAVCVFDGPEWVYQLVNPRYQQLFPGRELLGLRLVDALPEVTDQPLMEILHRVYDTGIPFESLEVLVPLARTAGGPVEDIYFDLTYQARYDEQGQIDGFITFANDVTEQVLARRQREAQQQQLRDLFEQAPVAIAIFRGPTHVIELANTMHLALWGRTAEQVLGIPLFEALPETAGHGFEELLAGVLATGEPYVAHELSAPLVRHGVLEEVFFHFVYQPLREADGQITGVVVVATDSTAQVAARRQAEAQERHTNDLNEELQAANEEIRANNEELTHAQAELRELNQELEGRVAQRTQEAQRGRAEAEHERGQLRALIAQAPVAISLLEGPELRVAAVNERMSALWGYPVAAVAQRPLLESMPELKGQGFDDQLRQVLATGVPVVGTEAPAEMLRDGRLQTTYYNYVYQALYEAHGTIVGVVTVAVDVTSQVLARQRIEAQERQTNDLNEELQAANEEIRANNDELARTQAQLREFNEDLEARVAARTRETQAALADVQQQRERLHTLFEEAPVAIAIFRGPQYVIELANPAVCAIWDRTPAQAVGTPLFELLPESAGQGFEQKLNAVMATEVPFVAHELPALIDRHGRRDTVYMNFVYQPLREGTAPVTAVTVVAIEVTDQVLARQQVQGLNAALQVANQGLTTTNTQLTRTNADLDNFIYTASHDLKAPISNIEGLLRLLEDMLPDELRTTNTLLPVLSRMQEAIERFTRTIGHLTEISKLQAEFTHPTVPTPLVPVLHDVRQDLAPLLAKTGGQLALEVAACPTLLLSEKNLRSLLYNLVSNALKYHHPDRAPRVHVSCRPENGRHVLRVQDNGLGLSEGQQAKLFGLFKRLHTHVEGTGVGLYMAKKMVENAHGTLSVESREGEGTTFTASFPA